MSVLSTRDKLIDSATYIRSDQQKCIGCAKVMSYMNVNPCVDCRDATCSKCGTLCRYTPKEFSTRPRPEPKCHRCKKTKKKKPIQDSPFF